MTGTMFTCAVLATMGLARAALHAHLAVNNVGKPKRSWPDAPVVSAAGAEEMEMLPHTSGRVIQHQEACAGLKSVSGTAYTVGVHVGDPEQALDVIADTGSNLLIVESCQCKDKGFCAAYNKCFREGSSSTLNVSIGQKGPSTAIMNFGSGSILTEVASDTVRIGSTRASMHRGVLLMIDSALDFGGPFEGILGLGLPNSTDEALALKGPEHRSVLGGEAHGESPFPAEVRMSSGHSKGLPASPRRSADMRDVSHKEAARGAAAKPGAADLEEGVVSARAGEKPLFGGGFVRQAGIGSFSVCFKEATGEEPDADAGVLRFNPPAGPRPLKNIGTMHWGLDFQGVSVGSSKEKLAFCSPKDMTSSQTTACGAIPDSGTTFILGPRYQLDMLFEALCDEWPRCRRNFTALSMAAKAGKGSAAVREYSLSHRDVQPMSKVDAFEMLLQDCDSWMHEPLGVNELPPIHFHVADDTGLTKALKLSGSLYTVTAKEPERKQVVRDIPGVGSIPVGWEVTGRTIWMCRPAFSSLDYPTAHNGPAWIIGMPLFHQYTVGFDVAAHPPTVSFADGPCGSCHEDRKELLKGKVAQASGERRSAMRPRRIHGKPRVPKVDTMQPF